MLGQPALDAGVAQQAEQVDEVLREVLGRQRGGVPAQGDGGLRVGARRAADAQVDPARVQGLEQGDCSATTSGAWLGSITPPEPTRTRSVTAARWAMSTGGLVLATEGVLWCSATHSLV